ncbi:Rod shape-determining protein MreC [Micavibrio aeruginosavorus EPB]|uniref:Cell shape-determining protein MreC n=1 Tax=Micavibrio aeruginosavorus EPB TaxID=349215 RepID=M4VKG7_9BACT|nr:Rod shape-determining protein MreC [Micavibrio aeruginosavorus EPB]
MILFMASAMNPATLQGVRLAATDVAAPLMAAVNTPFRVAADYVTAVTGLAELQAENERLKSENARLREWYQTALSLKSENESLQQLLNLKLPPPYTYITARVIADAGNTFARSLLILAGQNDGVIKGQAVLSGEGLVGRVIESGGRAARILLLTDMNSRVPVVIEGSDIKAIVAGQNSSTPALIHLPRDHELQAGARIVTSGHGGLFPPGVPVGYVVLGDNGQVSVQLLAQADNLSFVRIIDRVLERTVLGNLAETPAVLSPAAAPAP